MEHQKEAEIFPETDFTKMAHEMCKKHGHMPRAILSDNGFTYTHICARCGVDL